MLYVKKMLLILFYFGFETKLFQAKINEEKENTDKDYE